MFTLVIKASFGDCWEPDSQTEWHWGRAGRELEEGKVMAVSFDPLVAKVKLLAREVIWRCLPCSRPGVGCDKWVLVSEELSRGRAITLQVEGPVC